MMKRAWAVLILLSTIVVAIGGCGWYSVSGIAFDATGPLPEGIPGVTISAAGTQKTAITDDQGRWVLTGLSRPVNIAASKPGYSFSPEWCVTGQADEVFFFGVEESPAYSLSGVVALDEPWKPLAGVTISFTPGFRVVESRNARVGTVRAAPDEGDFTSVITESNGSWVKHGLRGLVTVTASLSGWEFNPSFREISGPRPPVDFTSIGFSVSGQVKDTGGHPLSDVRVTFDSDGLFVEDVVVVTNSSGEFSQRGLGCPVTVSVSLPGYVFSPVSPKCAGPTQNLDFTGTRQYLTGIAHIGNGRTYSAALRADGSLWMWGCNEYGDLGTGTNVDSAFPVKVIGSLNVQRIGTGHSSTVVLTNGEVSGWGYHYGVLLGAEWGENSNVPALIPGLDNVQDVSACDAELYAVKNDGSVWKWTFWKVLPSRFSELSEVSAICSGSGNFVALKQDGTVWQWGKTVDVSTLPTQVAGLTGIVAVSRSSGHTLALKSDGTVWSWGDNQYGQLGVAPSAFRSTPEMIEGLTGITAISAGGGFSAALKSDGTVWSWGCNTYGQLGDGTASSRFAPGCVGGLNSVVEIAAGSYHTMALKADGTVWTWGANSCGILGVPELVLSRTPVQVVSIP